MTTEPTGDVQILGTYEVDLLLARDIPSSVPIGLDGQALFSLGEVTLTHTHTITALLDGIVVGEVSDSDQQLLNLAASYTCGGAPPPALAVAVRHVFVYMATTRIRK